MLKPLRSVLLISVLAFRADPWRAVALAVLNVVDAAAVASWPLWLKLLADAAVSNNMSLALWAGVGGAVAISATSVVALTALNIEILLQERTTLVLDERLARYSLEVPGLEHHEHPEYKDKFALVIQERGLLAQSLTSIRAVLQIIVRASVTLGLLASVDPSLVLILVFAIVPTLVGPRAERIRQRAMEATAEPLRKADHILQTATRAETAKELLTLRLGPEFVKRHRRIWADVDRARTRAGLQALGLNLVGWTAMALGYGIAITVAVWRATQGEATAGDVLMALGLAAMINGILAGSLGVFSWFLSALRAVNRLLWLGDFATDARSGGGTRPAPERLERGLEVHDVSFRYPGTERDVLSNVSLDLPAGVTVAIVGENGAGKTTLVKLLCKFYNPTSGRIDADGTDLSELAVDGWRARMSAGFQDFAQFELVVRETVGVGDLAAIESVPAVEAAINRAGAEDVPPKLPTGLETQLGRQWEGGVDLSVGQWQKLALGRALMRERPLLLVLDEPTASLDAETSINYSLAMPTRPAALRRRRAR